MKLTTTELQFISATTTTILLFVGRCHCDHNTAGDHCERCMSGYYGSPTDGTPDDCQPCPCPPGSNCVQLLDGQVACLDCPSGHTGLIIRYLTLPCPVALMFNAKTCRFVYMVIGALGANNIVAFFVIKLNWV